MRCISGLWLRMYWRVQNVMKKKGMIIEKAEEYVIETDEKRNKLIVIFLDKKPLSQSIISLMLHLTEAVLPLTRSRPLILTCTRPSWER